MDPSYMTCCYNSARFAQFLLFTLRKPGFRKGNGLLDWGEPNYISWGDLYPGLAEVAVQFNA